MKKILLFCTSFVLLLSVKAGAQDSFSVRAQRYIEKYYTLAIAEQVRAGIPASVTLAQGVLETEAGRSELACSANNHFGIKCKSDYVGEKFYHDDDAPKECFKMYRCAEDSYKDHSDYLKRNQRYAPLFTLSQTDYAAWAVCLKRCGYATNPQYAQRLIKIIEDFKLQQYTYAAMDSSLLPAKPMNAKKEAITATPINASVGDSTSTGPIVLTTPFATEGGNKPAKRGSRQATTVQKPAEQPQQPVVPDTTPAIAETRQEATDAPAPAPQPAIAAAQPAPAPATAGPAEKIQKADKALAVASLNEANANTDSRHHIQVNDGPLPVQAAPPEAAPQETNKQVQPSMDTKYDSGKVITVNGLKAFYAYKGEMLLQYAVKYNVRYQHLLEMNDLPDAPLEMNMPVYLEKKLSSGTHARHTVKEGETMYMIAQMEGMQLKRLLALNMMDMGDEPAPGVILELEKGVYKKPALRATPVAESRGNMTVMLGKSTPPSDVITIDRRKEAVDEAPATATKAADTTAPKPYVETMPAPKTPAKDTMILKNQPAVPIQEATATPAQPTTTTQQAAPATDTAATAGANDSVVDDLAALKAELDKVVYTEDVRVAQPVKPTGSKKPAVEEEDEKEKKPKKNAKEDNKKKGGPEYYTIRDGETLGGIANRHNTTVKKLMQLNHIKADQIRAGRKLRIK